MELIDKLLDWANSIESLRFFPRIELADLIEMAIIAFALYYIVKTVQGTRAWVILKGVIVLLICYVIAYAAQFSVIISLFENLILFLGIAIVIIVQPDIRKLIEMIGTKDINMTLNSIISFIFKKHKNTLQVDLITDNSIQELVKGCFIMSKAKTGALIVIEKSIPLNEYAESGIAINADITSQLLINIFEKNTPLHDGAVIIQNNKVKAATCYLPLSESKSINKNLGTRHRAGIGATEDTDAIVIIVSEETGAVSVAKNGKLLHNIDREKLAEELRLIQKETIRTEDKKRRSLFSNNFAMKIGSLISAAILWMMIITAINPIKTTTFRDVEIQIINPDAISDVGKTYELIGDNKVDVTIEDRKDILDSLSESDIRIVADLKKLSYVNSVPLEVEVVGYDTESIKLSEQVLQISIENMLTTEFDIEVNMIGSVNDKYYISGIELENNTLIISGAESVINTIGSVKVDIDQSQFTTDAIVNLTPKIYDKNGELLNTDKFTLNNSIIVANVYLYNTKTIPINVSTEIKDEAVKKVIDSIDYPQTEIIVTGPDEVLAEYSSLDIVVPLDISMSDVTTGQFIKNVSIQSYLKDGLLVTQQDSKINLIIEFKEFRKEEMEISSEDISIENLGDGLEAELKYEIFNVECFTTYITNSELTVDKAMPYVDLQDLGEGEHEVHINFKRMDTSMLEDTYVKVTITKQQE